jgi:hypothetical protein
MSDEPTTADGSSSQSQEENCSDEEMDTVPDLDDIRFQIRNMDTGEYVDTRTMNRENFM